MPTPRTCRTCQAALSPDIRRCTRCSAPVTQFSARPTRAGGFVGTPRHDVLTSRWRGNTVTFGPVGRVVITSITILLGPWTLFGGFQMANPFFLWYLFGYLIAAVMVLKQSWVAVPVSRSEDSLGSAAHRGWMKTHVPQLFEGVTIPRGAALSCILAVLACVAVVGWLRGDTLVRYSLFAIGGMSVSGLVLAWLSGL